MSLLRLDSNNRLLGTGSLRGASGLLLPPSGFVFLIDTDGAYLIDTDGAYLMEAA